MAEDTELRERAELTELREEQERAELTELREQQERAETQRTARTGRTQRTGAHIERCENVVWAENAKNVLRLFEERSVGVCFRQNGKEHELKNTGSVL